MPVPPFDHFRFIAPIYERIFDGGATQHQVAAPLALPIEGWLLDAGGGTGRVSQGISTQTGGVVVLDFSQGMLLQALPKPNLYPVYSVVERLPFVDGAFERILIVDAFHHFHKHEQAVRELWRVLRPGGRLVLHEPNIARWQIKLIALGEKLLLMRSRFFRAEQLRQMFAAQENARVTVNTDDDPLYIRLIAEKAI